MRAARVGSDGRLRDGEGKVVTISPPRRKTPKRLVTPGMQGAVQLSSLAQETEVGAARKLAEKAAAPASSFNFFDGLGSFDSQVYPSRIVFKPGDIGLSVVSFRLTSKPQHVKLFHMEGPGQWTWSEIPIASLMSEYHVVSNKDLGPSIWSVVGKPFPVFEGESVVNFIRPSIYNCNVLLQLGIDTLLSMSPNIDDYATDDGYDTQFAAAAGLLALATEALDNAGAAFDTTAIGLKAYKFLFRAGVDMHRAAVELSEIFIKGQGLGASKFAKMAIEKRNQFAKRVSLWSAYSSQAQMLTEAQMLYKMGMDAFYEREVRDVLEQVESQVLRGRKNAEKKLGSKVVNNFLSVVEIAKARYDEFMPKFLEARDKMMDRFGIDEGDLILAQQSYQFMIEEGLTEIAALTLGLSDEESRAPLAVAPSNPDLEPIQLGQLLLASPAALSGTLVDRLLRGIKTALKRKRTKGSLEVKELSVEQLELLRAENWALATRVMAGARKTEKALKEEGVESAVIHRQNVKKLEEDLKDFAHTEAQIKKQQGADAKLPVEARLEKEALERKLAEEEAFAANPKSQWREEFERLDVRMDTVQKLPAPEAITELLRILVSDAFAGVTFKFRLQGVKFTKGTTPKSNAALAQENKRVVRPLLQFGDGEMKALANIVEKLPTLNDVTLWKDIFIQLRFRLSTRGNTFEGLEKMVATKRKEAADKLESGHRLNTTRKGKALVKLTGPELAAVEADVKTWDTVQKILQARKVKVGQELEATAARSEAIVQELRPQFQRRRTAEEPDPVVAPTEPQWQDARNTFANANEYVGPVGERLKELKKPADKTAPDSEQSLLAKSEKAQTELEDVTAEFIALNGEVSELAPKIRKFDDFKKNASLKTYERVADLGRRTVLLRQKLKTLEETLRKLSPGFGRRVARIGMETLEGSIKFVQSILVPFERTIGRGGKLTVGGAAVETFKVFGGTKSWISGVFLAVPATGLLLAVSSTVWLGIANTGLFVLGKERIPNPVISILGLGTSFIDWLANILSPGPDDGQGDDSPDGADDNGGGILSILGLGLAVSVLLYGKTVVPAIANAFKEVVSLVKSLVAPGAKRRKGAARGPQGKLKGRGAPVDIDRAREAIKAARAQGNDKAEQAIVNKLRRAKSRGQSIPASLLR